MDGTLLNSKHEVSDRFFSIFQELTQLGVQFVAASGRQYNSMVDKLSTVNDDFIFIAENGALVMNNGKEQMVNPLKTQQVQTILNTVKDIDGAHPVLCSKQNAFVTGESRPFVKLLTEYYSHFEEVDSLERVDVEVLKIAMYHFESSEAHIYPHVKHLEDFFKVKVSGTHWVDFSHLNAHKGFALEEIMKERQLSADEVLIFGDFNNDIEMMQLSDFSFAMANAHPNVKNVAKYETKSNDEFGVERVLEQLLQSKKNNR